MRFMARLTLPIARATGALAIIALSGCLSVSDTTDGLAVLAIIGGNNQTLQAGSATSSAPLAVRTLKQSGAPMAGVAVIWTITSGGGTLSAPSSVTDDSGDASVTYKPGTASGVTVVKATAENLTLNFTLNVNATGS
jgi:hypothetical protein